MAISASNILNISTSNLYRAFATPLANTSEISRGAFKTPYSTAIYPSNTAYGTNANPAVGGPSFVSSADALEAAMSTNTMNLNSSQGILEEGQALQNALSLISEQAQGNQGSIKVNENLNTAPPISTQNQVQTTQVTNPAQPTVINNLNTTSLNPQTNQPTISLTGTNAKVNTENAINFAAVNADYNVKFSDEASKVMQSLQNFASTNNIHTRMDGKIFVPTFINPEQTMSKTMSGGNPVLFDKIPDDFKELLFGGSGGGGAVFQQSQQQNPEKKESKKQPINLLG